MTDQQLKLSRRQLMQWSTPVVTAIALPAHASTSVCPAPPSLLVLAAPKCSGDPPVGTAAIELRAPDGCEMEIKTLTVASNDDKSSLSDLPSLPVRITDSSGAGFTFTGPASDAVSCLPIAQIDLTVDYCCIGVGGVGGVTETVTLNVRQALIDSVP